jgi:hypothetical protein
MAYNPALFEAQRRALTDNYAGSNAMQAYANFVSNQRSQRNLQDLNEQYNKGQRPLVASYGRRGMLSPNVRSGAFKSAMADYAKAGIKSTADLQRGNEETNQQYKLGLDQSTNQYQSDLANLENDKARQIEQDAMTLMQMRAGV